MAAALKKHGFQVLDGFDLDKAAFERKVREFSAALRGAEAGVFFYAGHGLQVAGQNYLVPVDAKAETADALDWEMLRLDLVHRTMERSTSTNILFLDACRDNPLARNLARAMGTRSTEIGRGLAVVESGVGTLISFSTQPGNVALDGAGRNSPFAGALVRQVATSNDDLSAILIGVRNAVMKETQRKQVPWEHSALTGRFYFNPAGQTAAPPTVASPRLSEAAEAWGAVKDATSIAALEVYVVRYKDTFYAELARQRIDELKKQQIAVATPPAARPAPAKEPLLPGLIDKTLDVVLPRDKPARCDGLEALAGSERRCLKPRDTFKDCDGCPEMVVIPAGEFMMGSPMNEEGRSASENPQHKVTIIKPFAVGQYAITRGEFTTFVRETNHATGDKCWTYGNDKREEQTGLSFRNPGFAQDDRHRVVCVNWDDAKAFAAWLSKKTGKSYRLLTEAEREYAARAGTTTPYWWGASISTTQANYNDSSTYYNNNSIYGGSATDEWRGRWRKATVPVDSFGPNPWGIYNVHGNVWEWVEDCLHENYQGAPTDGSAWTTGDCSRRVPRGGSWVDNPRHLRSASRSRYTTVNRHNNGGFRLARTLSP